MIFNSSRTRGPGRASTIENPGSLLIINDSILFPFPYYFFHPPIKYTMFNPLFHWHASTNSFYCFELLHSLIPLLLSSRLPHLHYYLIYFTSYTEAYYILYISIVFKGWCYFYTSSLVILLLLYS